MERTTMTMHAAPGARRNEARPWYREFWLWFLIVLPGASVILSFLTLYAALESMDAVVPHAGDSSSYSAPSLPESPKE